MFERELRDYTSTVKLLDGFENSKQKTLKLDGVGSFLLDASDNERIRRYKFGLLIGKPKSNTKFIRTNIRMTDIKSINKQGDIRVDTILRLDKLSFGNVPKMEMPAYHFLYNIKTNY